jgi:hypothetical protein
MVRCGRVLIVAIAGLLGVVRSNAAKPQADASPPMIYCEPASIAPGRTTEVTFHNVPSGAAKTLWTSFPGKGEAVSGGAARFRITLPADAPAGIGAVRVATAGGLSGPAFLMIDDLPVLPRESGRHLAQEPRSIPVLCAIDGASEPLASDFYRFRAKAGQRIAFEVVAQRAGSRMDPLVRLLDTRGGRELAYVDDTPGLGADVRFAHTFAADGDYLLEVRDADYEGSPEHRYRLRVGDFPAVTVAFPLGGKRGTQANLSFVGPAGEGVGPVAVRLPTDVDAVNVGVKYPEGHSSAFVTVLCGAGDEFVAASANHTAETAAAVTVPRTISGRFDTPGVRDFYSIQAKKGERFVVRGQTRSVGSAVDLLFQVFAPEGKRVAESKPAGPDDGFVAFAAPADGVYRLCAEDLNRGGGAAAVYRLEVERGAGDFVLSTETERVEAAAGGSFRLKVKAERRGYDGPITLSPALPIEGMRVKNETIAAGGKALETEMEVTLPPASAAVTDLRSFRVVGRGGGVERVVSTGPALRKMYPRLMDVPAEVDGQIGLRVRPAKAAASGKKD